MFTKGMLLAFTTTVSIATHPCELVSCTQYVPLSETKIVGVFAPVDQTIEVNSDKVFVALTPA